MVSNSSVLPSISFSEQGSFQIPQQLNPTGSKEGEAFLAERKNSSQKDSIKVCVRVCVCVEDEIMVDKRRSHKSSPSLCACRLATETWQADSTVGV